MDSLMKISFSPSVYEHAAAMIGRSPWDTSRDPDLLYAGHKAAFLKYHHTPVVVGIDIYNLEAEAYGAKVSVPGEKGFQPFINLFSMVWIRLYTCRRSKPGRMAAFRW